MNEANTYDLSGMRDEVDQIISEAQGAFEHMDAVRNDRVERLDELLHLVEDMRDHMNVLQRELAGAERTVTSLQARVSEGDRRETEHKGRILDGERKVMDLQHQLTEAHRSNTGLEKDRADVSRERDDIRIQHSRLANHFREFLQSLGERNRMIQDEGARFDALRQLALSLAMYGGAGQDEARRIVESDEAGPPAPQVPNTGRGGPTVQLITTDDRRDGDRA